MKANELRKKSVADLKKELLAIGLEQFNLRLQKSIGEGTQPHRIRAARRNIAKIKTILTEKKGS